MQERPNNNFAHWVKHTPLARGISRELNQMKWTLHFNRVDQSPPPMVYRMEAANLMGDRPVASLSHVPIFYGVEKMSPHFENSLFADEYRPKNDLICHDELYDAQRIQERTWLCYQLLKRLYNTSLGIDDALFGGNSRTIRKGDGSVQSTIDLYINEDLDYLIRRLTHNSVGFLSEEPNLNFNNPSFRYRIVVDPLDGSFAGLKKTGTPSTDISIEQRLESMDASDQEDYGDGSGWKSVATLSIRPTREAIVSILTEKGPNRYVIKKHQYNALHYGEKIADVLTPWRQESRHPQVYSYFELNSREEERLPESLDYSLILKNPCQNNHYGKKTPFGAALSYTLQDQGFKINDSGTTNFIGAHVSDHEFSPNALVVIHSVDYFLQSNYNSALQAAKMGGAKILLESYGEPIHTVMVIIAGNSQILKKINLGIAVAQATTEENFWKSINFKNNFH